jgi:hypothetical protein
MAGPRARRTRSWACLWGPAPLTWRTTRSAHSASPPGRSSPCKRGCQRVVKQWGGGGGGRGCRSCSQGGQRLLYGCSIRPCALTRAPGSCYNLTRLRSGHCLTPKPTLRSHTPPQWHLLPVHLVCVRLPPHLRPARRQGPQGPARRAPRRRRLRHRHALLRGAAAGGGGREGPKAVAGCMAAA